MSPLIDFILIFDPWLIGPFRWPSHPTAGYLLGTGILAFQCFLVGELSAVGVKWFNRNHLKRLRRDMERHHNLSEKALMMGDKNSYKAVNQQALDSFGHSFSLGAAIFCVSIWPVPFALAWMHLRFADVPLELPVHIPFLGDTLHYAAFFILTYVAARMIGSSVLGRIPGYAQWAGQGTGVSDPIQTPHRN